MYSKYLPEPINTSNDYKREFVPLSDDNTDHIKEHVHGVINRQMHKRK